MLVMVSMTTDEMIPFVAMYPDVWFMDTTAGKSYYKNSFIPWVHLFREFIYSLNSHLFVSIFDEFTY